MMNKENFGEISTIQKKDSVNEININEELDKESIKLGEEFIETALKNIDLSSNNLSQQIDSVYESFLKLKIGETASKVREYYYGNKISTYGVVYGSDFCISKCTFCPGGCDGYQHKSLSSDDIATDTLITLAQGHTEVCYLQADVTEEGFLKKAQSWLPKVLEQGGNNGLKTLVLNIQTLNLEGYKEIMSIRDKIHQQTGNYVEISIRTFQETYDIQAYKRTMPNKEKGGQKYDFDRRVNTQQTAFEAGADSVGFGYLMGLSSNISQELKSLSDHVKKMEDMGAKIGRIALVAAHAVKEFDLDIPYDIPIYKEDGSGEKVLNQDYIKLVEMNYATARLLMPHNSIVMSERDPKEILKKLAKYADHTTVGVHPSVGGNIEALVKQEFNNSSLEDLEQNLTQIKSSFAKKIIEQIIKEKNTNKEEVSFSQATVTPNTADSFSHEMKELGFEVNLSLDDKRVEKVKDLILERTGIKVDKINF